MRIRRRTAVIVITFMVAISAVRYFKVKYRGIQLSPVEFIEKAELVRFADTRSSLQFDGIREGRIYLSAWQMSGFSEKFHYWVVVDELSSEQREEIDRRILKEKLEREAREARKR